MKGHHHSDHSAALLSDHGDGGRAPEFSDSDKLYCSVPEHGAMGSDGRKVGSWGIREEEAAPDGEAQHEDAAACRICLEHDSWLGDDELIAPCKCKGTQQFVHRSCLDHWRSIKEGFAFAHCTTCKAQFHLRIDFLEGRFGRNMKFRMFVARDIFLVFLAIQLMIALLGGLTYLNDLKGNFRNTFHGGWEKIFSNHPIFFYYCFGALLFLATLGVCGLVMQCASSQHGTSYHSGSRGGGDVVICFGSPDCFGSSNDCFGGSCSDSDSGSACVGLMIAFLILVVIFAIIGLFYGILAASIGIQRILQRHYHILAKRELTMEYVVEDLHGQYTSPELDEEHVRRLRSLNLL